VQMIDLNKSLFGKIYKDVHGDNALRYHACVKTDENEKKFIKRVKSVRMLRSLNLKIAVVIDQDDAIFLAIVGPAQFSELPPEVLLQRLEEDAAILTVLGGQGVLEIRDPQILRDRNWSTVEVDQKGNFTDLSFVDCAEIKEILEDFSFYRVDQLPFQPLNGGEDRFLMLLLLLLDLGDMHKIQMKNEFLDLIINIDGFPFHLLHSSYVSQTWRYSYVDLYRCVELLYPIPRMIELRKMVEERTGSGFDKKLLGIELFKDVNAATGWRENESNGLERLIRDCPQSSIDSAFNVLCSAGFVQSDDLEIIKELSKIELSRIGVLNSVMDSMRDLLLDLPAADVEIVAGYRFRKSAVLISNVLYTTRNELVHFRQPKELASDDKIKVSFKALMTIIGDLYRKYHSEAYA